MLLLASTFERNCRNSDLARGDDSEEEAERPETRDDAGSPSRSPSRENPGSVPRSSSVAAARVRSQAAWAKRGGSSSIPHGVRALRETNRVSRSRTVRGSSFRRAGHSRRRTHSPQRDRSRGRGDVQRLAHAPRSGSSRSRRIAVASPYCGQAIPFGAEHERDALRQLHVRECSTAVRVEPDSGDGASSKSPTGTRRPRRPSARSAFGPAGSAQPTDRQTAAPNASADRISVPALPGSETCHSARTGGPRTTEGRRGERRPTTRAACASGDAGEQLAVDILSGHEHVHRLEAGRQPASTRSSPSATNRPSRRRCADPAVAGRARVAGSRRR